MNGDKKVDRMLGELEATLAAYGADAARWPDRQRRELAAFSASDPRAVRLCEEAAALDNLLDTADNASDAASLALMSRIMNEVRGQQDAATAKPRSADIVPIDDVRKDRTQPDVSEPRSGNWATVAMLAASLVVGVYIGGSGQLSAALEQTGLFDGRQAAVGQTVLLDTVLDANEAAGEDLL